MNNRLFNQFEGFVNTPAIFKQTEYDGFKLFKFPIQVASDFTVTEFSKILVLGKQVEHFFLDALKNSTEYQIIAHNIQISDTHRTLGELDFLMRELETLKILHIELMYKFYVYNPDIPGEMERWIGPNKKDSLLQKIQKVKTNQFPLLHTPETKTYLNSIDLDSKDIEQEICFKASLFIPKELKSYKFPHINEECIIGFWIHLKHFREYNLEGSQFFTPDKQDWPIDPEKGEEWYNFMQVNEQIKNLHSRKKSPLVWIKKLDGSFERIIVVWW